MNTPGKIAGSAAGLILFALLAVPAAYTQQADLSAPLKKGHVEESTLSAATTKRIARPQGQMVRIQRPQLAERVQLNQDYETALRAQTDQMQLAAEIDKAGFTGFRGLVDGPLREHTWITGPTGYPLGASVAEDMCVCGTGIPSAACMAERVSPMNGLFTPSVNYSYVTPAAYSVHYGGMASSPFYGGGHSSCGGRHR